MEPTLRPGQIAVLQRKYYRNHPVQPGDVVAFRWQGKTYVKRVYAIGGEPVTLAWSGDYCWPVRGELEAKMARLTQLRAPRVNRGVRLQSLIVPVGHFYSMGDNVGASLDSRAWGPIPATAILGRVGTMKGSDLPAVEYQ